MSWQDQWKWEDDMKGSIGSIVPSVLILFVGFVGFDHGRHGRRTWVKTGILVTKKLWKSYGINSGMPSDLGRSPLWPWFCLPSFLVHLAIIIIAQTAPILCVVAASPAPTFVGWCKVALKFAWMMVGNVECQHGKRQTPVGSIHQHPRRNMLEW